MEPQFILFHLAKVGSYGLKISLQLGCPLPGPWARENNLLFGLLGLHF